MYLQIYGFLIIFLIKQIFFLKFIVFKKNYCTFGA